jgi:hypothetical protein
MLRGQLADIILGAVFLFIGLAACSIAAIRRRSGVRLFIWLGIWSALYGAGLLAQSPAVVAALPHSIRMSVPYLNIVRSYLTVVVGLSAFLELSLGKVRLLIKILIFAGMAVALAGIVSFALGGSADKFIPYNRAFKREFTVPPARFRSRSRSAHAASSKYTQTARDHDSGAQQGR